MRHLKQEDEYSFWKEPAKKYHEVHEEITRKKKEDKKIEKTLFQVVGKKQVHMQYSDNQAMLRKQTMKKIIGLFTFKKK